MTDVHMESRVKPVVTDNTVLVITESTRAEARLRFEELRRATAICNAVVSRDIQKRIEIGDLWIEVRCEK